MLLFHLLLFGFNCRCLKILALSSIFALKIRVLLETCRLAWDTRRFSEYTKFLVSPSHGSGLPRPTINIDPKKIHNAKLAAAPDISRAFDSRLSTTGYQHQLPIVQSDLHISIDCFFFFITSSQSTSPQKPFDPRLNVAALG